MKLPIILQFERNNKILKYYDQFSGSETHPQYVQPPVIPGHEFIGEVVKLGPGTEFVASFPGPI